MKHKTKIIIGVMTLLFLCVPSVAHAQSDMDEPSSDEKTRTDLTEKTNEATSKLEQRLKERKEAAKTRVNAAEKLAIQARCKASQAHLRRLNSRIVGVSVSRKTVYDNLMSRLTDLGSKLKAKSIDTPGYDKQVAELQVKIDSFYATLEQYKEAVNDLATMDCAADPEAYKATLDSAKLLRQGVIQAADAIHVYLKDTIKPTLQSLRQQVTGEKQSSTQENQNHGE